MKRLWAWYCRHLDIVALAFAVWAVPWGVYDAHRIIRDGDWFWYALLAFQILCFIFALWLARMIRTRRRQLAEERQ